MPEKKISREVVAGLTTFVTMAYFIVVAPGIMSDSTGMPFEGVMTASVLVAFVTTLLMGLYARLPFALAPGMGICAMFTYTLVLGEGVPWPTALGIVFWSGVVFLIITVIPLREAIAKAIPESLRIAAAAGIGIFLSVIGFKNAGIVVSNPATLVKFGGIHSTSVLCVLGVAFILWLHYRRIPVAFIAGIIFVTLVGVALKLVGWVPDAVALPESVVSLPDFSGVFMQLDISGALKLEYLAPILAFLCTDLFDSISTFLGCSRQTELMGEDGQPLRMRKALFVDAIATLVAGPFGTSSGTTYIESASGVAVGGRTGLTAVVAGLCFLPFLFLGPLVAVVPAAATSAVLIVVGSLMFKNVVDLRADRLEEIVPAYLTLILIPLTFSITQGLLWGFIAHVGMFLVAGRSREIKPLMWGLAALAAVLLYLA